MPVRRWAATRSILDRPNERSSHQIPTPRGGGLAIAAVCLLGIAIAQADEALFAPVPFVAIIICGVTIAAISWVDDLYSISAAVRLTIHIAAAAVITVSLGPWKTVAVPGVGVIALGGAGTIITILWVTGMTNIYNFMDGIDGLPGTQAITAGVGFALIGNSIGDRGAAAIACLIAGAATGFLLYNWHPASIFMGDVGSALPWI